MPGDGCARSHQCCQMCHALDCRLDTTLVRFPDDEAARHSVVDLLVRLLAAVFG